MAEVVNRRTAVARALAQVGVVTENVASIGNADQYDYDWTTTDQLLRQLTDHGWTVIRTETFAAISEAAAVALRPDGSHSTINGYCPDCGGGCLRFDPEPIPYVEPSPITLERPA